VFGAQFIFLATHALLASILPSLSVGMGVSAKISFPSMFLGHQMSTSLSLSWRSDGFMTTKDRFNLEVI